MDKRAFHQNCGCFKNYFFYDMFFQQRNLHAVIKINKVQFTVEQIEEIHIELLT